jgi:DNA-binding CsgD family transcriptional regulator
MTKGKPWTKEQEETLIQLIRKGKAVDVIAKVLSKTEEAVHMKLKRLGLEVVVSEKNQLTTSSQLKLPKELPTIENVMKRLSAALSALEQSGIDKKEIIRLRCFSQGVKIYKELFTDYVHYREIEAELVELRRCYDEIIKKAEDDASRKDKS